MKAVNNQPDWWHACIFYQIYPRAFADSNADGVGDLRGVVEHLDYLQWLGIEAIWLSPIYLSPMKDGGYDISDYQNINPLFGNLADFDYMLRAAHKRSIKVILDWVPNHTSDQHPWFLEARSSRNSPKRNWYIWRDQPNNWKSDLGSGSAWTYDSKSDQYYLHSYLVEQPDLNWDNPEVVRAMLGVLSFWLDRGVDGFRADVINMIAKDTTFADLPPALLKRDTAHYQNQPKIHTFLKNIRQLLDSYANRPVFIGELALDNQSEVESYYGHNDELNLLFNFKLANAEWDASAWKTVLRQTAKAAARHGHWPSPVLSNHDMQRIRTRYGSLEQSRAAAVLLLTLPGAPFIYAGDEMGLIDAIISKPIDPGGRDGSRAPLPWNKQPNHGWPHKAILPFPPDAEDINYESLFARRNSILHLYRDLLDLRKSYTVFQEDVFRLVNSPENILAFARSNKKQKLLVIANFVDHAIAYQLSSNYVVLLSSDGVGQNQPYAQILEPFQALVLETMTTPLNH